MNLLARAIDLLPESDPSWAAAYLDRLALIVGGVGAEDPASMIEALELSGDPCLRMHARIARLQVRIWTDPDDTVPQVPDLTEEALRLFEGANGDRGLAAAWRLRAQAAWLQSQAEETLAAMEHADRHASRTDAVASKGLEQVLRIGPLVNGPFAPAEVRHHLERMRHTDATAALVLESHLADVAGDFETKIARTLELQSAMEELGLDVLTLPPRVARAQALFAQGRMEEALAVWDEAIRMTRERGQTSFLSTILIEAARPHYATGNLDEADRLAVEGEQLGAEEDVVNFALGRSLRARIAADRGDHEAAGELAGAAVDYADRTDFPRVRADAREALGYVLAGAGRADEAHAAYGEALEIWERYGWTHNAARVRDLLVEL